jgi:hypothetical protein
MRRVFGPRTIVEAAFLVAVPVIALAIGFGKWTIIGASAVAYLFVLGLEATIWREGSARAGKATREPAAAVVAPVVVETAQPVTEPATEPAPEPATAEHVRVLPREEPPPAEAQPVEAQPAEPQPVEAQPEPEPVRPPLVAVPELEPEPEPEPEPVAVEVPATARVVPIGVGSAPRQWNVWELERLAREDTGSDAVQDEERTFLLMYLREYADAGGSLPVDFDGLVRDSFGNLVGR